MTQRSWRWTSNSWAERISADLFLDEYRSRASDPAPLALKNFYIAYRAVVRAKVDCVRVAQGHEEAAADARRHIDIALKHLRAGTVQLIIVGGGPGTGKTTLSRALAEQLGAQVISTDDVRRELQRAGVIAGTAGVLDAGLYTPENVCTVYDEVAATCAPLAEQRDVGDPGRHLARCPAARACPRTRGPDQLSDRGTHLLRAA